MLKPPVADAQVTLATPDGKPIPTAEPVLNVGDWGTATTMLRPGGKARFGDNIFDVVADGAFIQPGVPVRVIEMQATRIVVEAAT
jgi:membrane-bound ClpP family serine protease